MAEPCAGRRKSRLISIWASVRAQHPLAGEWIPASVRKRIVLDHCRSGFSVLDRTGRGAGNGSGKKNARDSPKPCQIGLLHHLLSRFGGRGVHQGDCRSAEATTGHTATCHPFDRVGSLHNEFQFFTADTVIPTQRFVAGIEQLSDPEVPHSGIETADVGCYSPFAKIAMDWPRIWQNGGPNPN